MVLIHKKIVMARYSHKGHDTISHKISRYNTIRKCFTVCKNRKQAGNSTQQWSTVVLPINTVAAAGAWILADRWGDGRGRSARRQSGGRCSLKSRVIQQGYCEYWPPNNSSCGDSPQLLMFGGRTAQIFSDCAITKYLSLTVNTSTHPRGRAITAN